MFRSTPLYKAGLTVHPSAKSFSDLNKTWFVDRGQLVLHNIMPYDPIQGRGQSHSGLKVA